MNFPANLWRFRRVCWTFRWHSWGWRWTFKREKREFMHALALERERCVVVVLSFTWKTFIHLLFHFLSYAHDHIHSMFLCLLDRWIKGWSNWINPTVPDAFCLDVDLVCLGLDFCYYFLLIFLLYAHYFLLNTPLHA